MKISTNMSDHIWQMSEQILYCADMSEHVSALFHALTSM